MRLFDNRKIDQTCCSANSSLFIHARGVTFWCEAMRTMHSPVTGNPFRKERRKLQASCGLGARLDGMVSACELLLKTVMTSKPKMLTGLAQKGYGQVIPVSSRNTQMLSHRSKGRTSPIILSHKVEERTLYVSVQAVRTCEGKDGHAGSGLWKKRKLSCNEEDRRLSAPRASGLTSTGSFVARKSVELLEGRRANGGKSRQ